MGAFGAGCGRNGGLTEAFSSQVESLGGLENAIKWGLGACYMSEGEGSTF